MYSAVSKLWPILAAPRFLLARETELQITRAGPQPKGQKAYIAAMFCATKDTRSRACISGSRWTPSPTSVRDRSRGYHGRMRVWGLLVDLDGTLYVGDEPVEGAREALGKLKAGGFKLRYITNTTRKPRRAVRDHLFSLGFEVEEAEIFTPARAAAGLIGDRSCFPLVDESLVEDLEGITLTEDRPDHVLVGDLGEGFAYDRLNAAFRCLMDGAELIALQKNRYWRREDGLALDAGPFVAALEYASGKSATVVGKPEKGFFRLALEDLGLLPHEVAMVGDDAEADVAGAKRAGLKGVLVRTGKWSAEREGGEADLVLDSVADLPGEIGL
jgi:HAD superfamily hydrolase (TIGR01458 family)